MKPTMKRLILILAMVLLPVAAGAMDWIDPGAYDVRQTIPLLPGDRPAPYTRNWISPETSYVGDEEKTIHIQFVPDLLPRERKCYDQVKSVWLWFDLDKDKDSNKKELRLNEFLKEGWELQEPYHGEADVWLVREVCE